MVAILDAGESANDVDILNTTDVFQVTYNTSNNKIENMGNTQEGVANNGHAGKKVVLVNAVKLNTSAEGTTNDKYVGQNIKVTRSLGDGSRAAFLSEIAGYKADSRIAILGERTVIETSNTEPANTAVTPTESKGFANQYTFQATNLSTLKTGLDAGTVYYPQAGTAHSIPEGTTITAVDTTANTINFSTSVSLTANVQVTFLVGANENDFAINPAPGKFIPQPSPGGGLTADKYEILPLNGDKKVSINPAIQLLDYLTNCLLYTSPSPRDKRQSRMPSSA